MRNVLGFFILLVGVTNLSIACIARFSKNKYGWQHAGRSRPWYVNFDENHLEVKTKAALGSNKKIRLGFENKDGDDAGGVFIKFSSTPQYKIGWCGHWLPLTMDLPAGGEKIWKFEKRNYNVVVSCNNILVINSTASDESCDRWVTWKSYWDKETVRIRFNKQLDSASLQYRINHEHVPQWVKVPKRTGFFLDLQETAVDVTTESLFGSNNVIDILFADKFRRIAGGITIKFSRQPRYSLKGCTSSADFSRESRKKLREMTRDKIWTFKRTTDGVKVLVNGENILDAPVSDALCQEDKGWRTYWERNVDRITFYRDTASKTCRVTKLKFPTRTSPPPKLKSWTVSPRKGPFWYGSPVNSPSEPPTKHSPPSQENCWMRLVKVSGATKLAEAAWTGEKACERLCTETAGCHVVYLDWSGKTCQVFGEYNMEWQYKGELWRWWYGERGRGILAERKCFDAEFYKQENSTSPCGSRSWECEDRCIDLKWRCDGERDCKSGEDEKECPSFDSPFCPAGQRRCSNYFNCLANVPYRLERRCTRCVDRIDLCHSNRV